MRRNLLTAGLVGFHAERARRTKDSEEVDTTGGLVCVNCANSEANGNMGQPELWRVEVQGGGLFWST